MKQYLIYIVFLLAILASCGKTKTEPFTIKKGAFRASLVETGELNTVKSKPVTVPRIGSRFGYRYNVTGLVKHGAHVKKGDSIAQLDPGDVEKYIIENSAELEIEKANLSKMEVTHQNNINALNTQLEEAEANFELQRLSMEKFGFESEKKQQIKKLEFEQAKIRFETVKRKLELQQKINSRDRHIQKLRLDRKERSIKNAYEAIKLLTLRSPGNGIMQLKKNRSTRQMVKIGDEVRQRQTIASIPDFSQMMVKTSVSETDIYKINEGQEVEIRLDAFPSQVFKGKVSYISKLSHNKENGSSIKVFGLEILVDKQDPVLKPGMTVSCEIFTADYNDTYYVENECLVKENGQYFVYYNNGSEDKSPVKLGPKNNKYTVIYGDLTQGAKVIPISQLKKGENI